jgi:hypothetical protein
LSHRLKFDLTIWLRHPDFADVLVRREAPEGLESLGEVEGHEEGVDVRFELGVGAVVVTLNGRLLEGSVHPFDLTIGPGMVWLVSLLNWMPLSVNTVCIL